MRGLFWKITNWYLSKDALPYWCILAVDCLIVIFFYVFGEYCIIGGKGLADFFWQRMAVLSLCLLPYILFYKIFHTYANIVRYSSFSDLKNVALANIFASLIVIVARILFFYDSGDIFPGLRVTTIALCSSTLMICGWRVLVKQIFDTFALNHKVKPIYIYGSGSAAVSLCKSIRSKKPADFVVRGFISSDPELVSHYISGIPVYLDDLRLVPRMIDEGIKGIMVSPMMTERFRNNERLINDITESGIRIYMVPEARVWDGKSDITQQMLQKVEIEDLLPREKIEVDMDAIGSLLKGKKILITGAAGSIGSEMVRQIASFEPSLLVLIDQGETPMHDIRQMMSKKYPDIKAATVVTSITNSTRMEKIFSESRPDYVFHAAAYKHVPMMEDNPSEAVQNNIYGTRIIADLAVKYGSKKFVMISTDKAVNPTNVMGCSKRICEIYCQALNAAVLEGEVKQGDGSKAVTQFVTTRFGNVLGSNGSVIPIFREQIRNGGPVTVTHPDIIRFFMLIPEACMLVLQAGAFGNGGEIFVFDMGKPVRIADLAKRMISLSNAKGIEIKYTGLRNGEKLFEELLSDAEKTLPTNHPKIRVAQVRKYTYKQALSDEQRLYEASFAYDDMETVRIMKEIVPEFRSRNSIYEDLDER